MPQIMGILNVTPDSFSDGGMLLNPQDVVRRARQHIKGGATWLDVGAESTRPNAQPITLAEELRRLMPALKALLAAKLTAKISIDTRRAVVAQRALELGAHAINDVSAMADASMGQVVAQAAVPIVLMHWAGPSPTGGDHGVHYHDVVQQVCDTLRAHRDRALADGIAHDKIWLDPGLGFGKDHQHNLALTRELHRVVALGHPVVYGASRKRFLQNLTQKRSQDCDQATAHACCVAAMKGAAVLRVHEPIAVRDAVLVGQALRG